MKLSEKVLKLADSVEKSKALAEFTVRVVRVGDFNNKTQLLVHNKVIAESDQMHFNDPFYKTLFGRTKEAIEKSRVR